MNSPAIIFLTVNNSGCECCATFLTHSLSGQLFGGLKCNCSFFIIQFGGLWNEWANIGVPLSEMVLDTTFCQTPIQLESPN